VLFKILIFKAGRGDHLASSFDQIKGGQGLEVAGLGTHFRWKPRPNFSMGPKSLGLSSHRVFASGNQANNHKNYSKELKRDNKTRGNQAVVYAYIYIYIYIYETQRVNSCN